ncbi:hypothetical protein O6H91_19G073200 [Diphasiastrum complanatum]|uniref:Uncharacterized protein n=1 Tax=Diphasiastrum complanatum TaxID=34168 RepID=A0ACC2AWH2_DIPCM|nr:hypothetical protein O6H91_19G073200 [Diphasiastrum complanatum]
MGEGMQQEGSNIAPATEYVSGVAGEAVLVVEGVGGGEDRTVVLVDTPQQPTSENVLPSAQEGKDDKTDSNKFHGDGAGLMNRKVQKRFGRKLFHGEVTGFDSDTKWYKVIYEDGDREDLWWDELEPILVPLGGPITLTSRKRGHTASGTGDEKRSGTKRSRKGRHQTFPNGKVQSDFDGRAEDISDSFEDEEKESQSRDLSIGTENAAEQTRTEATHETPSNNSALNATMKPDVQSRLGRKRKAEARAHGKASSKTDGESISTDSKRSTRRSSSGLDAAQVDSGTRRSLRARSTPTKTEEELSVEQGQSPDTVVPYLGDGAKLVGRKTRKDFGGKMFSGEIIGYDPRAKYYKVRYEDGDEEELEWSEVEPTLVHQEGPSRSSNGQVQALPTSSKARGNAKPIQKPESPTKEQRTFSVQHEPTDQRPSYSSTSKPEERTGVKQLEEPIAAQSAVTEIISSQGSSVHRAFEEVRFASANDAENLEFYGWGEVASLDKSKCSELPAAKLLPTSSPIVHLAASRHHLAAITAAGQVWIWRNQHGSIHSRCNEWEHISDLDRKGVVLVDIAGPELDRSLGGYDASQEDQVPDPFYLAAVCSNGEDFILQGSLPQEPVRTYGLTEEPRHMGLKAALKAASPSVYGMGRVAQVSVGTVEEPDEPPFVGYITDTDRVYIRSATNNYMEEVNLVSGYTGRPLKIQCGRAYHAIIMSDDGRAWTWGRGYFHGAGKSASGLPSKLPSPFSVCQPALGTLVGRKWTHAVPNPAVGVYNVPATPIFGQGPCLAADEKKLKKVSIGAGMCSGISTSGRVHTWQTHMKGGLVGVVGPEKEALTPLGRGEQTGETAILSLGTRDARKVICVAGSLVVIVHKKPRGRQGWRKKTDTPITPPIVDEHAVTNFYS